MLTPTATSSCSVIQRAARAPAETAAAKGGQQYPAGALLTIFWFYRLGMENTCYSFPEAATVLLYAIYFSVLSWFSFKYPQFMEDSTASVGSLIRTFSDFAVRMFLLIFPAYIFLFS